MAGGSSPHPRLRDKNTKTKILDISSATTTELVAAAGSGNIIQVVGLSLFSNGANVVTLKSAATAISPAWNFTGAQGIGLSQEDDGWMETAANEALNITTTTTANVAVLLLYRLVR